VSQNENSKGLNFARKDNVKSFLILNLILLSITATGAVNGKSCKQSVEANAAVALTAVQKQYDQTFKEQYEEALQSKWQSEISAEWNHIISDKSGGNLKSILLKKLFIKKSDDSMTVVSFVEFLDRYIQEMKVNKVPKKGIILPAVVMIRGDNEILLVTPGIDPWPKDEGYRFLKSEELFNIPFRAVLAGLKKWRFPLMDSIHDASHFVSFIQNPKYAATLLKMIEKLPDLEKYPIYFSRRLFYALELLTLADPTKKEELKEFLLFPQVKSSTKRVPFYEYLQFFQSLDSKTLTTHAQKLIDGYDTFLIDFGGGVHRSYEKNEMIKTDFLNSERPIQTLVQLLGIFRPELSEVQRSILGTLPSETLRQLLIFKKLPAKKFKEIVEQNSFASNYFNEPGTETFAKNYQQRLDQLIYLQMARMEYGLWESANRITVEKWLQETLTVHLKPNSPILEFTEGVYGSSSILHQIMMNSVK
jgi:hypothetical protein